MTSILARRAHLLLVAGLLAMGALVGGPAGADHAPGESVDVLMPFDGQWANEFGTAPWQHGGGPDWSMDVYALSTDVQANFANPTGALTLTVIEAGLDRCQSEAGYVVVLEVAVDGVVVGEATYLHLKTLDPAVTLGATVANGAVLGATADSWMDFGPSCWRVTFDTGVHVHFRLRNTLHWSCWEVHEIGSMQPATARIGRLGTHPDGSAFSSTASTGCEDPSNPTPTPTPTTDPSATPSPSATPEPTPTAAPESSYQPTTPTRLFDSRPDDPLGPTDIVTVQVAGVGDVPAAGVGAAVVNITSTDASSASYLTAWASGAVQPTASNVNTEPGQDTPNGAIVPLGDDGAFQIYNNAGTGHVVVDLVGWFPVSNAYTPLAPFRLLDTRPADPFLPGQFRSVQIAGIDPLPAAGISAVVVNLTSTESTEPSFFTAWPAGSAQPTASVLNTEPEQDTPNVAVLPVGDDGRILIYNNAGDGHLLIDVLGWFPESSDFTPVPAIRALDTRTGDPMGALDQRDVQIAGIGALPDTGVRAIVATVTSTESTEASFLTTWATGSPRPNASTVNTEPFQDTPNTTIIPVGSDGRVSVYNNSGSGHVIIDVVGWF